jgi:hypothetical protein
MEFALFSPVSDSVQKFPLMQIARLALRSCILPFKYNPMSSKLNTWRILFDFKIWPDRIMVGNCSTQIPSDRVDKKLLRTNKPPVGLIRAICNTIPDFATTQQQTMMGFKAETIGLYSAHRFMPAMLENTKNESLTTKSFTFMNLLLLVVILLLLFGGGGFYWGGPAYGGGGLGLVLLICLIIFLVGGFRRK